MNEKDKKLNTQRTEFFEEVGEELTDEIIRLKSQRNSAENVGTGESMGFGVGGESLQFKEFKEDSPENNSTENVNFTDEDDLSKYSDDRVKIKIDDGLEDANISKEMETSVDPDPDYYRKSDRKTEIKFLEESEEETQFINSNKKSKVD